MQSYKKEGVKTQFFPVLGIVQYWTKAFLNHNDIMANSKRISKEYAPGDKLVVSNLARRLFFVLLDTQYTKEFLQNPHLYHKSQMLDWAKMFVKNGLVSAEGDVWKRHRRIVSNSFHYEFLKTNIGVIQDTAREFLNKVPKEGCKDYSVISRIQEITGEIVGRIFFGENLNSYTFEGKSITLALAEITAELSICGRHPLVIMFGIRVLRLPFIPSFRRLIKRAERFGELCLKIVADRKAKPEQGNDLLASLLATQKSEDVDKRFTDEEIVDEFVTFFVAGMDTTGHLIGMALYMLTQNPEYLQSLKEERDVVYNKSKRVTAEDVQKMEVLHAFLKETLRFYTPGPITFARVAITDHKILDVQIKKGDLVVPDFLAPAFDEKNFENPLKFSPERWRTAEIAKVDPFAFVPFSAGPRNCIGQHLAIIESKIIMSEFLNRFNFKLQQPYDLKMTFKFLYEPKTEFSFELTPLIA